MNIQNDNTVDTVCKILINWFEWKPSADFESCLLIDQVSRYALIISSKSSVNLLIDTRSIIEKMK